jgi:hypothetical protein
MSHVRRVRDHWLSFVVALALAASAGAACKKAEFEVIVDGGDSLKRDVARDVPSDATTPRQCPADVPAKSKGKAESCTCDRECQSGFCMEGVCCTSACTANCMACNLPSSLGDCAPVPAGARPADSDSCLASTPATCGLDGTCDGKGGCRKYVRGIECKAGTCDGDSLTGIRTCDGEGNCSGSKSQQCPPYTCDPSTSKCSSKCSSDTQCSSGHQCVGTSCGKSTNGAECDGPDACLSGFCVNNVCCNIACSGNCVSCKETGSVGRCTYIATGLPDDRCGKEDRTTCGRTGTCDGSGHCALYPADTVCGPSSCAELLEYTPRTCDGQGTCQVSHIIDCAPFLCSNGACETSCDPKGNDVCESGHACVSTPNGGVCGKRKNGQVCQNADDCESGQCVDGVCCESSCTGACRSCNLPGSPGQCLNVGITTSDPHKICVDLGVGKCSTNGLCDGQGACQLYASGETCGPDSCDSGRNTYYPAPICNASGQCPNARERQCDPYLCNGSSCFRSCTTDAQCSPGNVCAKGSCGLKIIGTECDQASECSSGFCAQGVCCDSACDTACKACNLAATNGTCSEVTGGVPDPQGKCAVTPSSTCGTTGTCQKGQCERWAQGLRCGQASCPSNQPSQVTPASLCDGQGVCKASANQSCGGFACANGACKVTCTTATEAQDCVSPATCVSGSCGLKVNGAACSNASQCQSGFCTEGVCCNSACTDATTGGLCRTCKGTSTSPAGTCSNVNAGSADPKSRCAASNAANGDCSNSGVCDGAAKCQAWSASTGCRKESCAAGQHTFAATCDGKGACPTAKVASCNPYICSATSPTCLSTCDVDADCTTGLKCLNHSCGKGPGDACAASTECASGLVCSAQGVCCDKACSGSCETCKLSSTSLGSCLPIPKGTSPRVASACTAAAKGACGNTGTCDGNGACDSRDTCTVAASCFDKHTEVTTVGLCSTSGCGPQKQACQTGYLCTGTACAMPCSANTDCDTNYSCVSGACVKKANGAVCAADVECTSDHCFGKVCCSTSTCPAGYSCAGGTCTNVCTKTADCPTGYACSGGTCKAGADLGQTCALATDCASGFCADGVCCSSACDGECQACNLTVKGTCSPVAAGAGDDTCPLSCSNSEVQACDATHKCTTTPCGTGLGCASSTACLRTCGASAPCLEGYYCSSNGSCVATKALGAVCASGSECTLGNCVDGVCCSTSSCDRCYSCNVTDDGKCSPVPLDTADGSCVLSCSGNMLGGLCDGSGQCKTAVACPGGNVCAANGSSCATSCGTCAEGYYCGSDSKCAPTQAVGARCGADAECQVASGQNSGHCVDGICCSVGSCSKCSSCTNSGSKLGACTPVAAGYPDDLDSPNVADRCTAGCLAGGNQEFGCDGAGACRQMPASCSPGYLCGADDRCATSCGASVGCADGYTCNGSTCDPTSATQ